MHFLKITIFSLATTASFSPHHFYLLFFFTFPSQHSLLMPLAALGDAYMKTDGDHLWEQTEN